MQSVPAAWRERELEQAFDSRKRVFKKSSYEGTVHTYIHLSKKKKRADTNHERTTDER